MVCEYEFKDGTIRVNCLGCIYGASFEDYEICMARTLDKIIENKNVKNIILAKNREYEYDYDQTRLLVELAEAITKIIKSKKLVTPERIARRCTRYLGPYMTELQEIILKKLRGDPLTAYMRLRRIMRHMKMKLESNQPKAVKSCYYDFVTEVLEPVKEILDDLKLIKRARPFLKTYHLGERSIYREIFHPSIRPNFMLTKYMIVPPPDSEIIDRYKIPGKIDVEIYKKPDAIRYFYHVIPPEFKLSEDRYTILDAARKYMTEHKPKATEFTEPEKMREVFSNIGKDMISDLAGQMNVKLSEEDVEEMTSVLTRYTAGLGILEILLADEKLQDIFINSPIGEKPIYVFHDDFQECETNLIPTQEDAEYWATRFRMMSGRPLDEANPVLDTQTEVPGGRARIAIITRTLSPGGLSFSIRRHRDDP